MSVRQSASRLTSARSKIARPPSLPMLAATAAPFASSLSDTTTDAPSLANNRAIPSPIPAPEPVMTAMRFSKRALFIALRSKVFSYLGSQKADRFFELVHSINAVFDRNPSIEALGLEHGKNFIVIVQAFSNNPVLETLGITA